MTAAVPVSSADGGARSRRRTAGSVSRRLVIAIGAAAFVFLAGLVWVGSVFIEREITTRTQTRLAAEADQGALVLSRALEERRRQVTLLASLPAVVDAARLASDRASAQGLAGLTIPVLEKRFDATRTMDVDPRLRRFLLERAGPLNLAEVLITESHGFNAVTTARTSDFVQSDEDWWQVGVTVGMTPATAAYDESANQISVSISGAIRERASDTPAGVIKVVFSLAPVQTALIQAATQGGQVDLVGADGELIASSAGGANLARVPGADGLPKEPTPELVTYRAGATEHRAAVRLANAGTWRIVAHEDVAVAGASLRSARLTLAGAAGVVFAFLVLAVTTVHRYVVRRIGEPAAELAVVAEAVAGGDLNVSFTPSVADDEIGRLHRATGKMIDELRTLTLAIRAEADDAARLSSEITAATVQMSSTAQQMATTSGGLSEQAEEMAHSIQVMAASATQLREISTQLTSGTHEGVERLDRLRVLAHENRTRLDESATELDALIGEVEASAASAQALATASKEIRDFVTLVQQMARQSKLLALNAAMEAARAGAEGDGFAVVAEEVRRLAATSAQGAERAELVVAGVLRQIEESRASSARSATRATDVRNATHVARESFAQVEQAVSDTTQWTTVIEGAAVATDKSVAETTQRLEALARGTESFAAAMQEVAASTQEQSASTEEIASASNSLSSAATRLAKLVATFSVGERRPSGSNRIDDTPR